MSSRTLSQQRPHVPTQAVRARPNVRLEIRPPGLEREDLGSSYVSERHIQRHQICLLKTDRETGPECAVYQISQHGIYPWPENELSRHSEVSCAPRAVFRGYLCDLLIECQRWNNHFPVKMSTSVPGMFGSRYPVTQNRESKKALFAGCTVICDEKRAIEKCHLSR